MTRLAVLFNQEGLARQARPHRLLPSGCPVPGAADPTQTASQARSNYSNSQVAGDAQCTRHRTAPPLTWRSCSGFAAWSLGWRGQRRWRGACRRASSSSCPGGRRTRPASVHLLRPAPGRTSAFSVDHVYSRCRPATPAHTWIFQQSQAGVGNDPPGRRVLSSLMAQFRQVPRVRRRSASASCSRVGRSRCPRLHQLDPGRLRSRPRPRQRSAPALGPGGKRRPAGYVLFLGWVTAPVLQARVSSALLAGVLVRSSCADFTVQRPPVPSSSQAARPSVRDRLRHVRSCSTVDAQRLDAEATEASAGPRVQPARRSPLLAKLRAAWSAPRGQVFLGAARQAR